MKKTLLSLVLLASFVQAPSTAAPSVWDRTTRSLFKITQELPLSGKSSFGTGFCLPGSGSLMVTAAHVVDGMGPVTIQDAKTLQTHEAIRTAFDTKRDVALFLLKDGACQMSDLEWAKDVPHPGTPVVTVGFGGGKDKPLITDGIISGEKGTFDEEPLGTPAQLNALFGHSGAPVLVDGKVVGMVVAGFTMGNTVNIYMPNDEIKRAIK